MKPDTLPLGSSYTPDDNEHLKQLPKTCGSVIYLEDLASAYDETGETLYCTAEELSNLQVSTGASLSKSPNDKENATREFPRCTVHKESKNSHTAKLQTKKSSATMGCVSDVIGRGYITPRSESNGSNAKEKPVKLYAEEFPASVVWDEKKELVSSLSGESMTGDIGEFLYKMLGEGFQLETSVIQDVVGQCGYNMPMSIDRLLNMSAATLEKSDDVISIAAAGNESLPATRLKTSVNTGDESTLSETETERETERSKKKDIQRGILDTLFSVPSRTEETQICNVPVRPVRRSPHGQIVTKPLEETLIDDFTFITRQPVNGRNGEANDSSYEDLRKAVMDYWATMKDCYKAATDAFSKRDYKKAELLMKEGNLFMRKAREADEKSAQILTGDDDEEEISLHMYFFEPREAVRTLKLQLLHFCGLPSISHLKVIVGTGAGDNKDMKRKRLITRLLEKEGIPWTEEGNGWTLSIQANKLVIQGS